MRYKKSTKILATLSLIGSTALVSAAETTDQPHFSQIDLNGDNFISKAELTAQAKTLFDRTDANNDGQLSAEEFAKSKRKHDVQGNILAKLKSTKRDDIFKKLDTDKDGQLSAEEKRDGKSKLRNKIRGKLLDKLQSLNKDDAKN